LVKAQLLKVNFKVLKNRSFIRLLCALLVFIVVSCIHKRKEVTAVERRTVKKEVLTKKTNDVKPNEWSDKSIVFQQKLGLSAQEVKSSKLYSFINDWYGSPYKYGGCQKSGVDCSCFVSILYSQVFSHDLARTAGDMFKQCDKIAGKEAREGDLVFFKINDERITHVGIYLKNDFFAHASTSKGVVLSSLNEAYYKKYFFCAGKLKKS
jgi:murein DD-endopeptidase / murein LD-carboxypeptidase